jgi:RND superfamily putative drug exporter
VVRGLLVPALIAVLGRWNWWLPAPAARLLRIPATPAAAEQAAAVAVPAAARQQPR